MLIKEKLLFLADTAVMVNPTAEQIANTAIYTSRVAGTSKSSRKSYVEHELPLAVNPRQMAEAARLVMEQYPEYVVDGEMQADTAVSPRVVENIFPFCHIKDGANILLFPNLDAGNITYKLLQQLGGGEVIGPFLIGVNKPAHVVQRTGIVDDIFNTAAITALQCQAFAEGFNNK